MAIKRYLNSEGYIVISELEHHYVAKQVLGRDLMPNEVVHHINGKKSDNNVKNLCVMDAEKHEHFHSWLIWKKEKSGSYPSINNQKKVLEQEYGGTLLEKATPPTVTHEFFIDEDEVSLTDESETEFDDLEKFVVRRNKVTNKAFIEFDEEVLISPEGRGIEIDLARFGELEEVFESELTEKQLKVYRSKIRSKESEIIHDNKQLEIQKKLFNELRKVRKRLADEAGVPVYIIFDNKTLYEMSEMMPETEDLMLQVRGVGLYKLQLYGADFIAAIKQFKSDRSAA